MPLRLRFPNQADHTCPRHIKVEPCDGPCSILDLDATSFAKPFGITLLYGLIRDLRRRGEAVRVVVRSNSLATYLWRMNVHRPFGDDAHVTFEPNLKRFTLHRWFQAQQLLELTIVQVANDDEVVAAEERIWGIIAARAPAFLPLADQIRTALVELISNVERHSGTGQATVIAQTHDDCVRLAVGDVGIGVRRSLASAYNLAGWTDPQVLRYATGLGVSATPGSGGAGLWTITDIIRQMGHALHLASGTGVYSVYRTRDESPTSPLVIPGTIVEVAFNRPSA